MPLAGDIGYDGPTPKVQTRIQYQDSSTAQCMIRSGAEVLSPTEQLNYYKVRVIL